MKQKKRKKELLKERKQKYLKGIYFNPINPSSFGGINKLERFIKEKGKHNISRKEIQDWLQSQEVHTTNILPSYFIKRRKVVVPYIDYMWDIDTASMRDYMKKNAGFGYFVLAIDIMSRYVWCQPIKSPTGDEVKKALHNIFKEGRRPDKIRSDKGTEYNNNKVQSYLHSEGIEHFVTQNEVKANYSERCIQTIKGKLMRYMRSKQTVKWFDQLQNITTSYNETFHRSIKQSPASVTKKDEDKIWNLMYFPSNFSTLIPKKLSYKFEIGDVVRITKLRHPFQRYYSEHWTNELFIIKERNIRQYIPVYILTDYARDPIEGIFYERELQKINADENATYNIEKVIKNRVNNGVKESLIRWMGWPKKFDSWIPSKNIKSFS